MVLTATGPSGDRPERLQHHGRLALRQVAAVGQDVRRQDAGGARLWRIFLQQFLRRAVGPAARVLLVGDDDGAHESPRRVRRWLRLRSVG
jgi:hypothetical protein